MEVKGWIHECRMLLGIERNATSHGEKLISAVGALAGILAVYYITKSIFPQGFMGSPAHFVMITSMGASAVLLFAVPHGALSQPWAVLGGHLISAFIGVTCQKFFPNEFWVGALAVGLAVGAMHYLRCIHPPGGATALAAVIGGPTIHALGYHYLVTPVLINLAAMLLVALLFNGVFGWRRYPAHLARRHKVSSETIPAERQFELTHEDFAAAMQELDSYVDVTTEGLAELLELAKQHAERNVTHPKEIIPGQFYSNGKLGQLWAVRQVIDASDNKDPAKIKIIYKVLAGEGAYDTGICSYDEFRCWARFGVSQVNGQWVKVIEE